MANLEASTIECLSELRLSEIPKDWVDQVWESDFCESCDLPEVLLEDFAEKQFYREALKSTLDVIRQWAESEPESQPLGFWAVLVENGMSHHSLVALLYAFINFCDKNSPIGFKIHSSVLAANIYVLINKIPGCGAYKIFHSLLLCKAVDILQCWHQTALPDGKRKQGTKSGEAKGRKRTRRGESPPNDSDEEEDFDQDDGDVDVEDSFDNLSSYDKKKLQKEIKNSMFLLILDVTMYLETKSIKDPDNTIMEHLINLYVDLTRIDPVAISQFDSGVERIAVTDHKSLTKVAYKALEYLSSSLHGEVEGNLRMIFKHLISNILSTYKTSQSSSSSISQGKLVVKDNAVTFVCFISEKIGPDAIPAVRCLIQHLCMKVPDQAEYRNSVGKAVSIILHCLNAESQSCILVWITKYSKNSKIGYRVFALDLILQLLNGSSDVSDPASERQEPVSFSYADLLQLIVSRCSDKAPTVRAKALCHLALCICSANNEIAEAIRKLLSTPLVNGSMESHSSTPLAAGCEALPDNSISAMIRRRVSDEKVLVRKAALQVLESIIRLNKNALCKKDLETLHDRTMDQALSVRKQAMVSITALLVENPDSSMLHSIWLDAILPVVMDRETTAQEKCLQTLEEVILDNVVKENRSQHIDHIMAWKLLQVVAGPSGQELRHYFQKVCLHWAKQGKFSTSKVKAIMSHTTTENASAAWLLLAELSSFKPKLDYKVIVDCWNEYKSAGPEKQEVLCRVLKVLENLAVDIPNNYKEDLIDKLQSQLSTYKCSPEVIVCSMSALSQLCETLGKERNQMDLWCSDLLKASEAYLSSVILNPETANNVDEEAIIKHLFTVGEAALVCPRNTNKRMFLVVQSMIITPLQENGCEGSTPVTLQKCLVTLSATVKAYAFITLGKLCLQNEALAKECIAALTKELEVSQDPAVRNNITVVLCDLCVRYTNLVDRYIPNIARGLRDKQPLVRRQTLTLLTHLLQEDYVKWKGSLFFRFITALVDEDCEIRKFADFCLVHLLLSRHPGMFHQHFIETIFHFNGYDKHKVYNRFPQTDKEKELFALKGSPKIKQRMSIYKFLLDHTTDEQRFNLTGKLCQEVLGAFVDGAVPFNDETKPVLKDALAILSSKNIKLSSTQTHAAEDFVDEGDQAGAAIANARTKFLTQLLGEKNKTKLSFVVVIIQLLDEVEHDMVVKKNMIENIVPIIIELKNMLEKHRSPLLKDLMLCLKILMTDYRSEIQDVLSADRQLANEIEFDLRKFEEEQKEQARQLQERTKNLSPSVADGKTVSLNTSGTAQSSVAVVGTPVKNDFITPQLRSPGGSLNPVDGAHVSSNVPSTPIRTPRGGKAPQPLMATALMNSARKAIDSAKKAALQRSRLPSAKKSPNRKLETPKRDEMENEKISEDGDVPVNTPNGKENQTTAPAPSAKTTTSKKQNKVANQLARAASTPEGDRTHMSHVSFSINTCGPVPLSPIINLAPMQAPKTRKGNKKAVGKDEEPQVLCLTSPEHPTPKPRTWNIHSPCQSETSQRRTSIRQQHNESIANRTRSRDK